MPKLAKSVYHEMITSFLQKLASDKTFGAEIPGNIRELVEQVQDENDLQNIYNVLQKIKQVKDDITLGNDVFEDCQLKSSPAETLSNSINKALYGENVDYGAKGGPPPLIDIADEEPAIVTQSTGSAKSRLTASGSGESDTGKLCRYLDTYFPSRSKPFTSEDLNSFNKDQIKIAVQMFDKATEEPRYAQPRETEQDKVQNVQSIFIKNLGTDKKLAQYRRTAKLNEIHEKCIKKFKETQGTYIEIGDGSPRP
jgi:hypothetical protein